MIEIKNALIHLIVNNLQVIIFAIGALLYSCLEYFLGEGKHGSLIGLIKYLMKKKDEPKS